MRQDPAYTGMVGATGAEDVIFRHRVEGRILGVLIDAVLAVTANFPPCVGMSEREAVGADANHITVGFVEVVDDEGGAAGYPGEKVRDGGSGPELGAWDGTEGVKEEPVESGSSCKERNLSRSVNFVNYQSLKSGVVCVYQGAGHQKPGKRRGSRESGKVGVEQAHLPVIEVRRVEKRR